MLPLNNAIKKSELQALNNFTVLSWVKNSFDEIFAKRSLTIALQIHKLNIKEIIPLKNFNLFDAITKINLEKVDLTKFTYLCKKYGTQQYSTYTTQLT